MRKSTFIILLALCFNSFGQQQTFTEQDTLRGSITPQRAWWNLDFYHLNIEIEPDKKFISGSNTIRYSVLEEAKELQVDLQNPLTISKVTQDGETLKFRSNGNAHFIDLKKPQRIGETNEVSSITPDTQKKL
ncbi:MAG TPA: hypothetical protein VLZ54_02380 [Arenibacter sp.]|nr:hypothetical protein [Arenibacter sp.]